MDSENYYSIQSGDIRKYVGHAMNNAFNFSGRASRKEYFVCFVAIIAYNLFSAGLVGLGGFATQVAEGSASFGVAAIDKILISLSALAVAIMIPLWAVYILLAFFIAFMSLSVSIRRFHDSNHSGWRIIPVSILVGVFSVAISVLVGLIIAYAGIDIESIPMMVVLTIVLTAVQYGLLFLIMLRKPSDPGENAFGEPAVYD